MSGDTPIFALRFISGKYQGGEFPLFSDREIIIGRSSDLDMVLVEDMVSRKHAKIVTQGEQVYIMDLGSTNGTFVNGERIKKSRLKEGDRILIGTSIVKLISGSDAALDTARGGAPILEDTAARSGQKGGVTMSGSIREVPLPDLLQLFGTSKKSGVLVINGIQEGRVYLRQGRIFYAMIDGNHDLGPMKSICRLMTWEQGDFELQPPTDEKFQLELDDATEAIIMETMRQVDELHRIQTEAPPPTATLALAEPLLPPLSDLKREQLDVLQLVYNLGVIQDVLDQAPGTDYESYAIINDLLKNDYLRVL
ncbi:MAG: FHA domain-containing protein [Deltaproteobacteria bacterium]|nr:FHA domain-containing protein [Deltaproteobacteria bacterium]